ncbi:MAG: GNAT family N-acetyltransferase [Solirubrobacterales bacterium]
MNGKRGRKSMSQMQKLDSDVLVVRRAEEKDVPRISAAIENLMAELRDEDSASLPAGSGEACRRLVTDPEAGLGFVVERKDTGDLMAAAVGSYHYSVRYGGVSLYIQDYWVAPEARGAGVGVMIAREGFAEIQKRGVVSVEGVLPPPAFSGVDETRQFWVGLGGEEIGMHARIKLTEVAPNLGL